MREGSTEGACFFPRTLGLGALSRCGVHPRCRPDHHGCAPENERAKRVVDREQATVGVGLADGDGQGGEDAVDCPSFAPVAAKAADSKCHEFRS